MLSNKDNQLLEKALPFWQHLLDHEKSMLLHYTSTNHYKKGQILHSVDRDCLGVLIVKSGVIRIYTVSTEGREISLFYLHPHSTCVLSASCVLQSMLFDVTMIVEEDCEVIRISSPYYRKLLNSNIYVEAYTYKLYSENYSKALVAINNIIFQSLDYRLANFLVQEATKSKEDTIHMTHEQIARHLGSVREVISRMLSHLARLNIVSLSRGKIKILDMDALREIQEQPN